jgi:hypothetical protein
MTARAGELAAGLGEVQAQVRAALRQVEAAALLCASDSSLAEQFESARQDLARADAELGRVVKRIDSAAVADSGVGARSQASAPEVAREGARR